MNAEECGCRFCRAFEVLTLNSRNNEDSKFARFIIWLFVKPIIVTLGSIFWAWCVWRLIKFLPW